MLCLSSRPCPNHEQTEYQRMADSREFVNKTNLIIQETVSLCDTSSMFLNNYKFVLPDNEDDVMLPLDTARRFLRNIRLVDVDNNILINNIAIGNNEIDSTLQCKICLDKLWSCVYVYGLC